MSELKEGTKHDSEKPDYSLIPPIAINELARVLTFGAKKYDKYNWAKGISYTRVLAAILRHVFAYMRGESLDPETGISHIAHAMCGCAFILHYEQFKREFDDRPKDLYKSLALVNTVQFPTTNEPKKEDK